MSGGENIWNTQSSESCDIKFSQPSKINKAISEWVWRVEFEKIIWESKSQCTWLQKEILEGIHADARLQYLRHYRDMTPQEKNKVHELIKDVSWDLSKISVREIFDTFAKYDKTIWNWVVIRKINDVKIIRSIDIENLSISELRKIASNNDTDNSGSFLVLSPNWFMVQNSKNIQNFLVNSTQKIANGLSRVALDIAIKELAPWFNLVEWAVKAIDSKKTSHRANQYNSLFWRN